VFAAYAANRNYHCNYGNRLLSGIRRRTRRATVKLAAARNCYFPTRDTRGCLTPGPLRFAFVRGSIVLGIRQAYENTRALIATAAHNHISVSDCSKTIVRSRQFLIIIHVRLKSAMMPLTHLNNHENMCYNNFVKIDRE